MKIKEAVSNVESFRKVLQDFLAPELRGISVRLEALDKRLEEMSGDSKAARDELRSELHAVEARMKETVEQAKLEILLKVELSEARQQISLLAKENTELKQKSPQ